MKIGDLPKPIYIENLSSFSQYRYLFLCVIVLVIISLYILSFFNEKLKDTLTYIMFPHLKKEIHTIIYKIYNNSLNNFCYLIINKLANSKYFRLSFFIIHFIIFIAFRIILLLFLIKFIFCHGDLRLILYCIPISFIIWLLSFMDYYLNTYFSGSCTYIRELLNAEIRNNNFVFSLTQVAKEENYKSENLAYLADKFLLLGRVDSYFYFYKVFMKIISYLLLIVQIFLWFYLVYIFFYPYLDISLLNGTTLYSRALPYMSSRFYVKEIHFVKPQNQKDLEKFTAGVHNADHPAVIDVEQRNPENNNEVRYYGSCTKGRGTHENLSHPISLKKKANGIYY